MPAVEQLVATDGPVNTPYQYRVPPTAAMEPSVVCATFDASAAAGPFLPCVSIYSQDGKLISRTFPGTVVAGDVAEVTYGPFLKGVSAAPSSGGTGSSATGDYTIPIPPNAVQATIDLIGGGGGGGAALTAGAGVENGSGGGGGGAWQRLVIPVSALYGPLVLHIGAGGLGGSNVAHADGFDGEATTLSDNPVINGVPTVRLLLTAPPGKGGKVVGTGGVGGQAISNPMVTGIAGGQGGAGVNGGAGVAAGNVAGGAPTGGGGGGGTLGVGSTSFAGGAGGSIVNGAVVLVPGGAGGLPVGNAGKDAPGIAGLIGGAGGGGGAGNSTAGVAGGKGGAGFLGGGGGGGGGGEINLNPGGNGGNGFARVLFQN